MLNLRARARDQLFSFFRKLVDHREGRSTVRNAVRDFASPPSELAFLRNVDSPYVTRTERANYSNMIVVTGRFRSGSTLLWNLFRHSEEVTAFYEPFNERKWFSTERRTGVDASHLGVTDYWAEYEGLTQLARWSDEKWNARSLYMSESHWNSSMRNYINDLYNAAPSRPMMQFNRIDFRLGWLRKSFEGLRIVHVYRHPRDQWCSTLGDLGNVGLTGAFQDFSTADRFYLTAWVEDLRYRFPFLEDDTHPYRQFYYLWKLSWLFGQKYADYSVAFEELVDRPNELLAGLFSGLDLKPLAPDLVKSLVKPPRLGKWCDYADDAWFRRHESECEDTLTRFLATDC